MEESLVTQRCHPLARRRELVLTDPNINAKTSNPRLSTGLTSTSLDRAPGPSRNFVRGKAGNVPFWPGGLEDASSGIPEELEDELMTEGKGIRTIPPGFTRGLRLFGEGDDEAGFDGLDRIQVHSALGQGDPVSTLQSEVYLLGSQVSLSRLPHAWKLRVHPSSEARKSMTYCRHR